MRKILITVVGLAICCSFLSCKSKKNSSKGNELSQNAPLSLEIKDSSLKEADGTIPAWHPSNKAIMVLFGYNYNDDDFVKNTLALLSEKFGLKEEGGIIVPVIFPDGFRHKEKAVTVDLYNLLDDDALDIKGFVSLGAPEKTYRALTKLQDKWGGQIPFPVISLFPQDEILGIEDTSCIVINQIEKAESEENMITESVHGGVEDADQILVNAVNYIKLLKGSPEKDAALAVHVKQMLPGKKIHRYTDSETGLYSINHFVIE